MISDIFWFLHLYYEFYFYLFAGCIGSSVGYFFLKSKSGQMLSIKINCLIIIGCFTVNSFISILLKHHLRTFNEFRQPYIEIILFKLFISIAFGSMCVPCFKYASILIKYLTNTRLFKRNQYGIIIFMTTIAHLILNLPATLNCWCTVWYVTDYSMGIGSRFFIGTFLKLFYDEYLEEKIAYRFCIGALIIIIALVSYLLNEVIIKSKAEHKKGVLFIILLFIASPGYVSAMWSSENMGRLETYTFLLSLLSVIMFTVINNIYIRYITITVFSCISMAIYQGNLFMYYPIILMLIVWDCLRSCKYLFQKRVLGLVSVVTTIISFIFFQFCSYTIFENAGEMVAAIREKTNITIEEGAVNFELFQSLITAYDSVTISYLNDALPRERTFLTYLLLCPLVVLVIAIYLKCRKERQVRKAHILSEPYIYFVILNFAIVPQFVLNTDWGRWMIAIHIISFFGILYLIYQKDCGMLKALDVLNEFINNHMFLSIMIVVYLAGLNKFLGRVFIPETEALMSILSKLLY